MLELLSNNLETLLCLSNEANRDRILKNLNTVFVKIFTELKVEKNEAEIYEKSVEFLKGVGIKATSRCYFITQEHMEKGSSDLLNEEDNKILGDIIKIASASSSYTFQEGKSLDSLQIEILERISLNICNLFGIILRGEDTALTTLKMIRNYRIFEGYAKQFVKKLPKKINDDLKVGSIPMDKIQKYQTPWTFFKDLPLSEYENLGYHLGELSRNLEPSSVSIDLEILKNMKPLLDSTYQGHLNGIIEEMRTDENISKGGILANLATIYIFVLYESVGYLREKVVDKNGKLKSHLRYDPHMHKVFDINSIAELASNLSLEMESLNFDKEDSESSQRNLYRFLVCVDNKTFPNSQRLEYLSNANVKYLMEFGKILGGV